MTLKALIFDFDGLIVDTELPQYIAWQDFFAEHQQTLPLEDYAVVIGTVHPFDPVAYLEARTGLRLNRDEVMARYTALYEQRLSEQTLLPGVKALTHAAKRLGLKTAIASSSPRAWVLGYLERFADGIAPFDVIVTREDVTQAKPAPDLFLKAAQKLGIRPEEALVLEDSPNGLIAAQAAGMRSVAVPNQLTRGLDLSPAGRILESLEQLDLAEYLR